MPEPAFVGNKDTAPPFIEGVTAVHKVTMANEEMAGTLVESDSDCTDYKPQTPSKSVVKPLSDMRSKIERALADLNVVTRTVIKEIVEERLTKWINTLQW